jgi:hypothetical protein
MYGIATRAAQRVGAYRTPARQAAQTAWGGGRAGTARSAAVALNWLLDPAATTSCGGRGPPTWPGNRTGPMDAATGPALERSLRQ